MTYAYDKSACERCHRSMVVEILFTLLHFLLVEQAHMSPAAIRKTVNNRATEVVACNVVDTRTDVGSNSGEQDNEKYV